MFLLTKSGIKVFPKSIVRAQLALLDANVVTWDGTVFFVLRNLEISRKKEIQILNIKYKKKTFVIFRPGK